jgi:hypothetical protein
MINHSSLNSNVNQLLTDLEQPAPEELEEFMPEKESDNVNSDNDEDVETCLVVKKEKTLGKSFYYHIFATERILKN